MELNQIPKDCDTFEFSNDLLQSVNFDELINHLCKIKGLNQIQSLIIGHSSQLKNLKVIRAFPNLRYVSVYGLELLTLDGLEWFKHGEYMEINTGTHHKRRITQISSAPLKRLVLYCSRSEDIVDISQCISLTSLDLFLTKEIDFSRWSLIPLDSLGIMRGKFKQLGNTMEITTLRRMRILGCRKLEEFIGDNSGVTWMIIEGCKELDLRSVRTFHNIESLIVNGSKKHFSISEIGELNKLKSLWLDNCNMEIDIFNLSQQFPKLNELFVGNIQTEQAMKLREQNPNVQIKTPGS